MQSGNLTNKEKANFCNFNTTACKSHKCISALHIEPGHEPLQDCIKSHPWKEKDQITGCNKQIG